MPTSSTAVDELERLIAHWKGRADRERSGLEAHVKALQGLLQELLGGIREGSNALPFLSAAYMTEIAAARDRWAIYRDMWFELEGTKRSLDDGGH